MSDAITREDSGDVTILTLPCQGDTGLSDALSETFQKLGDDGRYRVVVDCTHLEFINSMVIGILVSFHQRSQKKGGGLAFAHVSLRIEDVFRLTKLDTIFSWYNSIPEAVESFSA